MFRTWPLSAGFRWWWERPSRRLGCEGINLPARAAVKQAVSIPVLCTGGFQTASVIAAAIERGDCDAVTIARPLVANPDLVRLFEQGHDAPPRPCTYCNKCLFNFVENPLGCYDESRFDSREEMVRQILSVYAEPAFVAHDDRGGDGRMSPEHRPPLRWSSAGFDGQEPRLPLEPRRAASTTTTARAPRRTSTGT